jgi:hypothetical protein
MLTSTCLNCGNAKEPADYANNYCSLCDARIKEHVEHAVKTGGDVAAARREALMERAHNSSRNRPDPRGYVPRVDTTAFEERLKVEPGSLQDPRRGGQ